MAQGLASQTTVQGVPGSKPGWVAVRYGLEQVTINYSGGGGALKPVKRVPKLPSASVVLQNI